MFIILIVICDSILCHILHVYFHFPMSNICVCTHTHIHTYIDLCLLNRSVSYWSYKRCHSLLSAKWGHTV